MKPIKTEHSNVVFVKEGCLDLPGTAYKYADGTPGVETCWELSPEELEQVKKTGRVYLYTVGEGVPPMFLSVKSELVLQEDAQEGVTQ